ncbi:hypothetical protein LTR10_021204 [Elasticomyces elasticus]|uniref:NmrA-like domain-containing protein n=1 Tax=Exophiala sideris TaxID=1016849 RepID=A0ABR0IZG5_9EURO|nr:hypothetical protein LTR10_021204 [Elasticomyces elasticus]KAK5022330.1 hypothetical protein LTS07_010206 [Exophiala sideris]KAK5027142.1 hypothetical protein LTR13_009752 [Exophiala sideris]KAK5051717.1 hypothetical protein LTR69_010217 [Exophiala sideris]KAK5177682.1 hypothetical protein LTR44_009872 [Eurotiomycetes sp. CCFEE 6388]
MDTPLTTRNILVTGATGKQGGAAIKALLANPPPFPFHILALTRKSTSKTAQTLAANPKITVIEGDIHDPGAIFSKAGGVGAVWGVFLVTIPSLKKDVEEQEMKQGKDLIDAAVAHDYNVEKHLYEKVRGTKMTYTVLRPTCFMDNLTPDFPGRVFATMWARMGDRGLQFVATKDIGIFAALAFSNHESDDYKNKGISLAGDTLTQAQANEIFWRALGRPMIRSYDFMGTVLQWMIPEMGVMFRWFAEHGYEADEVQCRRLNKDMHIFESWLLEESKFRR